MTLISLIPDTITLRHTLAPYLDYAPYFLISLVSVFLLTPLVGFFCKKLGIMDRPASVRRYDDPTKKTRIKKVLVPRAGGLAVIIVFIVMAIFSMQFSRQLAALLLAIAVLTIGGLLDDKYEISGKWQFVFQIVAALIIVASGISIDSLQNPASGNIINLRQLVLPINLFGGNFGFALPADILTVVWIVMMVNAINWIFGADGLGEGITFIAFLAILFISIKLGQPEAALMATIAAGGILGFLPFNFPPAKIISGTTGTTVYGFLIGVLSILGGAKVSASVIVLIIPLIDMIWVIIGRIHRHRITRLIDVFKVTTVGDDTHLHHRLLKLGFSAFQITLIEWAAVGICAVIAFATADLPKITILTIIGVTIIIVFLLISLLLKKGFKVNKPPEGPPAPEPPGPVETPESKYAY